MLFDILRPRRISDFGSGKRLQRKTGRHRVNSKCSPEARRIGILKSNDGYRVVDSEGKLMIRKQVDRLNDRDAAQKISVLLHTERFAGRDVGDVLIESAVGNCELVPIE